MHTFVINLEKDVARRKSIVGQLKALGLSYEISPAVYGAGLSPEDRLRQYDHHKAKWRLSREMVPSEIGCALSHLNVYRNMIEREINYALVLEDDVKLPAGIMAFLDQCEKILDAKKPTVWLLSPAEGSTANVHPVSIDAIHSLLQYRAGFYTSSYIITQPGARALLKELYPVGDVADCWRRMNNYRVIDLFIVEPPVIVQNQDVFGSSTTSDYHEVIQSGFFSKVTYKLSRACSILWETFYGPYRRWFRPYAGLKFELTE